MNNFINLVFDFFNTIYDAIVNYFTTNSTSTFFSNFIDKQIFDGTMISIGLTWNELLRIFFPSVMLFFFILLIFKLFKNMIGLFTK